MHKLLLVRTEQNQCSRYEKIFSDPDMTIISDLDMSCFKKTQQVPQLAHICRIKSLSTLEDERTLGFKSKPFMLYNCQSEKKYSEFKAAFEFNYVSGS